MYFYTTGLKMAFGVETCCHIEGVTHTSCADVSLFPSLFWWHIALLV